MKTLRLKRNEDRRVRAGHLWVYSNEVDISATPLKAFEPGDLAELQDSSGAVCGVVYVNPNTLLCARILSSDRRARPDVEWLNRRIARALAMREAIYDEPFYRMVFGESDGLPGLVVDRYGEVLSVQVTTAGMEVLRPQIAEVLATLLSPRGIVWRDDASARTLEGLSTEVTVSGQVEALETVRENGLEFGVDLRGGQKTGWFYDQRDNRARLARYLKGQDVLDLYAYSGAWGLSAIRNGAESAVCVDSSQAAIDRAVDAANRAGVRLETHTEQVLPTLKSLREAGRKFGVCIVDPPALIKRRKDFDAGFKHYVRVNHAAMNLLHDDAWLVSCSCSHPLTDDGLRKALTQAAKRAGRRLQIVEIGGQSADHPIHPAMPETRYLNAFFCRVTGA